MDNCYSQFQSPTTITKSVVSELTPVLMISIPPIHPNKALFIEGARIILNTWTALRIAVEQEWGGPLSQEKAAWLVDALVEHFDVEGKKVEKEDLEDILLDVMTREFNVYLEDESEREIASLLFDLYHECISGRTDLINKLREKQPRILATAIDSICTGKESESDEEDGEEDVEIDCGNCDCKNTDHHHFYSQQ
jgi:pre-rRNA-processing protein TSR2